MRSEQLIPEEPNVDAMHPNAALVTRFYEAFQKQDAAGMAACYHRDVVFRDPAFGELHGDDARAMWTMLAARAKDFSLTFRDVRATDAAGSAHWEADYTFRTGRRVHNVIEARFEFKDGLISRHVDTFDLWRWSRQALGAPGVALGWTPMMQQRIRREALAGLAKWRAANP